MEITFELDPEYTRAMEQRVKQENGPTANDLAQSFVMGALQQKVYDRRAELKGTLLEVLASDKVHPDMKLAEIRALAEAEQAAKDNPKPDEPKADQALAAEGIGKQP